MSNLYSGNTLPGVPALSRGLDEVAWKADATELLDSLGIRLPDDCVVDRDSLAEFILGEKLFGQDRYRLSLSMRLYYTLKPLLPRNAVAAARRIYRRKQEKSFPLAWPVEDRYVRFVWKALGGGACYSASADGPESPESLLHVASIWPDGAAYAFVLTHDVETASGQAFVRQLADIDEKYGFRASFNFVPERYAVDRSLLQELRARGFEIGVHGLRHDGRLFFSSAGFQRRAAAINRHLREWGAVGFRSPLMHRNPVWMQELDIEWDSSFFDTDSFEPMPGGTMSIWPFRCGRFIELPYTLVQDHTLLVTLGHRTPKLWLEKVNFISRWRGMALLNAHPDYLIDGARRAIYEDFLQEMAALRQTKSKRDKPAHLEASSCQQGGEYYWHALPREVARWWRMHLAPAAGHK